MGERTPAAVLNAPASGRLAVAEAITNILAADIRNLADIRLSANWMAACGEPGEDADLYATVRAVSLELCASLGITIPVGKDSLSMRTAWKDAGRRSFGDRPRVAHRIGVRSGAGCACDADPGTRSLAFLAAAADRSGRGTESAGRQLLGAGACPAAEASRRISTPLNCCSRSSLRCANSRMKACCSPITTVRTAVYCSRCSKWPSPVIAACTSIWERRRTSLPRASPRNWAQSSRYRRRVFPRCWPSLRGTALGPSPGTSASLFPDRRCACVRAPRWFSRPQRLDLHRRWSEVSLPHPGDARQSGLRAPGILTVLGCGRPRIACPPELRSRRGCRGAVHRHRRASGRRHPAGTGRQQSDRNGCRVHAGGIRCL